LLAVGPAESEDVRDRDEAALTESEVPCSYGDTGASYMPWVHLNERRGCPVCGQPSTLYLAVLKKDFRLYFVRVARWNSAYFVYCGVCNASAEIDKETGRQLHAALTAGASISLPNELAPASQPVRSSMTSGFREGDIVIARRDVRDYRPHIKRGQRFRVEKVLRGGNLRITGVYGTKYMASRGHFDLVRKLTRLPPGSRVTAAQDILDAASGKLIFPRDTRLEVLAFHKGQVKVIDQTGFISLVHPAQLDVEPVSDDFREPPPSAITAENNDVFEDIRKLAELHNQGAISSEEFESKKAELLKRI
jgi:hypothetical protein